MGVLFQNNPCCTDLNCVTDWKHIVVFDIKLVWNCLNWATQINPAEMLLLFGINSTLKSRSYMALTACLNWVLHFKSNVFYIPIIQSHNIDFLNSYTHTQTHSDTVHKLLLTVQYSAIKLWIILPWCWTDACRSFWQKSVKLALWNHKYLLKESVRTAY